MCEAGFTQCTIDMCLYVKDIEEDVTVVGVYVDNLLVTGTLIDVVECFSKSMV